MAEQEVEVNLQVDDKEMFQAAMAEEPKQEERARDEKGRFVAAEKETPPEAKAEPEKAEQPAQQQEVQPPPTEPPKEDAHVPSWRLREVTEARASAEKARDEALRQSWQLQADIQAMRDQIAKLNQPKQEPVDFFANPEQAIAQHITPIEQRLHEFMREMTLQSSRATAIAQYGAKAVADMEQAIDAAMRENHRDIPGLRMQMQTSKDPVGIAMAWYQNTPANVEKSLREKLLKDETFIAEVLKAKQGQLASNQTKTNAPVVNLPPSLNKAPSAGNNAAPDDGDMSDRALFRQAMTR
jgi:hypothetical protein